MKNVFLMLFLFFSIPAKGKSQKLEIKSCQKQDDKLSCSILLDEQEETWLIKKDSVGLSTNKVFFIDSKDNTLKKILKIFGNKTDQANEVQNSATITTITNTRHVPVIYAHGQFKDNSKKNLTSDLTKKAMCSLNF